MIHASSHEWYIYLKCMAGNDDFDEIELFNIFMTNQTGQFSKSDSFGRGAKL